MNIFGAFTFGSLIKTFLPGFVWLIAIGILEADISQLHSFQPVIFSYAQAHDQAALILAIPASILLGLLSNIVVFMGVNDRWVRNPVRRANPGLFALYDRLAARIRDRCWDAVGEADAAPRRNFDRHADVELIMLPSVGADVLAYIREQYWYHLEFQINLLLSIIVISAAVVVRTALNAGSLSTFLVHLGAYFVLAGPIGLLLFHAARKNYQRHVSKMMSLMAAVLGPKPRDTAGG